MSDFDDHPELQPEAEQMMALLIADGIEAYAPATPELILLRYPDDPEHKILMRLYPGWPPLWDENGPPPQEPPTG